MKKKLLPRSFHAALWSYDISKIDPARDKKDIITQVLNYGDWHDIKRLFKLYSEREIKEVVKTPRKGVWLEKVLHFWCTTLNIKLKQETYHKAIFSIHPKG